MIIEGSIRPQVKGLSLFKKHFLKKTTHKDSKIDCETENPREWEIVRAVLWYAIILFLPTEKFQIIQNHTRTFLFYFFILK